MFHDMVLVLLTVICALRTSHPHEALSPWGPPAAPAGDFHGKSPSSLAARGESTLWHAARRLRDLEEPLEFCDSS